jgi:hypothetical protein
MKDDVIKQYLKVLENPDAEKNYIELKKYYESLDMIPECVGLIHLLKERFNVDIDLSSDKKQ